MKTYCVALALSVNWHFVWVATAGSSSSSVSPPVVTPIFEFAKISDMTTCEPASITWMYSPVKVDDSLALALTITNNGVPQAPPPSTTATGTFSTPSVGRRVNHLFERDGTVNQSITIGQGVDPLSRIITWASVNVTQGWYAILGAMNLPGVSQESSFFFVFNGTDTSCLRTKSVSRVSSVAGGTSSDGSIPRSSSVAGGSSTTGVTLPVSSSKNNRGATVGGLVGGVVGGVLIVLAALILILRCRSRRASANIPSTPTRQATDLPISRPPRATKPVLALDRPIAPAVVESQEAMFIKLARLQEEMRAREREASEGHETPNPLGRAEEEDARLLPVSSETPHDNQVLESAELRPAEPEFSELNLEQMSTPDLARQLRAMAQRVALMEARMQSHGISDERPPDYSARL
ncbi:hypothetical protein MVEN_02301300 [Mycena venus]|uniref:Uncharacterized protein n=1 Tax=Mycena venus TaxID=2733690 RepID=A0A8H7CFP8_9AGAR|nr:hypothetical protein MVEN_02301300 [Mycena venus]